MKEILANNKVVGWIDEEKKIYMLDFELMEDLPVRYDTFEARKVFEKLGYDNPEDEDYYKHYEKLDDVLKDLRSLFKKIFDVDISIKIGGGSMEKVLGGIVDKIWTLKNSVGALRSTANDIEKQIQEVMKEWFRCKAEGTCDLANPAFWRPLESLFDLIKKYGDVGKMTIAEIKEKMQDFGEKEMCEEVEE